MYRRWFFTGDKHGKFNFLPYWCEEQKTTKDDILVILGDAGINFWLNEQDIKIKNKIAECPITLFCIHGNHEERPENISSYRKEYFVGGEEKVEDNFPNIKFAISGQTYNINGYSALVLGGAYSIDKYYRLEAGIPWFKSEQLSNEERETIKKNVHGKYFDFVLSHTCPYNNRPTDLFLDSIDQSKVDNSMELWLEEIKNNIDYSYWFFGHYHDDRKIEKGMYMLYNEIIPFEKVWF